MDIPEGATVPQDHLPPTVAPVISEDELLSDMPELAPPTKLRIRQRNKIMKLAIGMRKFLPETPEGEEPEGDFEIDTDDMDDETLEAFLDVMADIDEFAESIASDAAAYVTWSQQGDSYGKMSALLSRYSSAVGESSSSSS